MDREQHRAPGVDQGSEAGGARGGIVVVGVDGSAEAERALRYAVVEAQREGRGIRLVHVAHESVPLAPMLPAFSSDTVRAVGTRILAEDETRARELAAGPLHVEQVLAHGPRASALLAHAQDAALIVLGPRSSTLERFRTGSMTSAVASRALCSVVAVPEEWLTAKEHRRVIAAVDGSPSSSVIIGAGFAAARARRSSLVVVHAWRPLGQYDAMIGGHNGGETWMRQTEPAVWELIAGWRADFPDVEVQVDLHYQRPVVALAEDSRHADLLVMGRRGERAPLGLALGSTARAMLRAGLCPVEVVPVPRHDELKLPRQARDPAAREEPRPVRR